jgi:hypothetical protein
VRTRYSQIDRGLKVTTPHNGARNISPVLLLDDWSLAPFTASQRRDMLELLEDRYGNRSTLVTSQMPVDKWKALIEDPAQGGVILDRFVRSAYRIELKGESMHRCATKLTTAETSDQQCKPASLCFDCPVGSSWNRWPAVGGLTGG